MSQPASRFVWNELAHVESQTAAWDAPPAYLRVKTKGGSYTLRALTDRLMKTPMGAVRKPAVAVEDDLRRWRQEAINERTKRGGEARTQRRLARRCARQPTDLSFSIFGGPLVPVEPPLTQPREHVRTKTFFAGLKQKTSFI